jgi:hypothetical protein
VNPVSPLRGISFLMLIACTLAGCSHDRTANEIAAELRARMLPAGASATDPTPSKRTGTTMSTDWEIHSSLSRNALESWLSGALKPDFASTSDTGDGLRFAKYDDGESERLEIHINQEAGGNTTAKVRLVITPD